jgi:glycosyltransferase involved in cell wall biosynthesis
MQALAEPRDLRRADREAFAANFTWDAVAEAAAVALESFVPRVAVAKPKPRIAWVSPTPPSRTGIADYAVEVARTLSDRFELEWIIDADAEQPSLEVSKTWLCLSRSDFANRHRARPYDLFVYHLGNSRFHAYQLPMLQDYPGLAVLHDLSCGYIGDPSQDHSVWPGSLLDEVRFHGDEFIAMLVESNLMKASIAPRFSRMSRRILQSIVAGIVHSNTAWQETRRLTDAPISVVPMIAVAPLLRTRQEERKRLGIPADRWVVTTLGLDDHAKRTPTIVKAIANLPDDLKQRTLFIVAGEMGQQKKRELEQLARERGIPGQVECRGRVELDDLAAYAFAAEVNIQLRYPSNGETSAVLLRALAAGATCITSDSATMAEFPNSVTLKVRSPAQDEVDLTAALTRLASDESLRVELGQNARRFIAERHSPQIVAAHYAAAVEQAMQQLRLRPTLLR